MTIKYDFGYVERGLDILQKVKLPNACRRALYETGPYMRRFHAREMAAVFRDPVPFTLRSIRYQVEPSALSLKLSIGEDGTLGQTPSDYLAPVFRQKGSTRGTAVTTRFARQLQRVGQISGGTHLVPNLNAKLMQKRRNRVAPSIFQNALSQLGANEYAPSKPGRSDRYFAIDRTSSSALKPGVYRAKGETISQLFSLLDAPPSVPQTYDWERASFEEMVDQIEARISMHLQR